MPQWSTRKYELPGGENQPLGRWRDCIGDRTGIVCDPAARVIADEAFTATMMETTLKVKDLIALLQKEDPEALVIKYQDGGTTITSAIEGLSQAPAKLTQGLQDQPAILIE